MNTAAVLTDTELSNLVDRGLLPPSRPRFKLLRDVPDADLVAGSIGRLVSERSGDDREFVLIFDSRPGLRVTFREPEFDSRSPEYLLERLP